MCFINICLPVTFYSFISVNRLYDYNAVSYNVWSVGMTVFNVCVGMATRVQGYGCSINCRRTFSRLENITKTLRAIRLTYYYYPF